MSTAYQYDALNRLTQKSYSDGVTLPASFGYDQTNVTMGSEQFTIANSIGRLSWTCVLNSSSPYCPSMTATSYDPMGRIAELWQSNPVNSNNIYVSYGYDLLGDEANRSLSGNTYSATYNGAGLLTSFTATDYTDSTNPASLLSSGEYDAFGHLISATFANGLSQSWAYDNRGRPHAMAVGTICSAGTCSGSMVYSYSVGYAGDSDVLSATDSVNGTWSYTYDGFNRLATSDCSANCPNGSSTEGFSYGYDRYSNRWNQTVTTGSGGNSVLTFNGPGNVPNNRMDGYSYDAAGNLLNDGFHNYKYDAENRIVAVDAATTYGYDAQDRRVSKTAGGSVTAFTYDREGHIILTNSPTPTLIETYAAGLHLGTYVLNSAKTDTIFYYNHSDWLGTERAQINLSGTACEKIASLPFGDGQTVASTCGDISPMHFTGKERDTESGLDNFGARYNASSMGRFMTPDWAAKPISVPYAKFGDPQTLNLYSYVENAPLNRIDADGHAQQQSGDAEAGCFNGAASCTMSPNQQPPAQNQIAQEEDPNLIPGNLENEKGEIDPNAEAERALEPVEAIAPTPASPTPVDPVLSRHSAEDTLAVRNGADSVDPQLAGAIRQKDAFDSIASGGFKVTNNPLGPNQESNVTITSPLQPGVKLNLRVETHSLTPGGPPVRHVNVELVTPRTGTTPKVIINTHITQ